jgi:hypothetical protein
LKLYRVVYYDESAAPEEPGGVLYIPPQGAYRIDNPKEYRVLYLGNSKSGVCAEVFYRGIYRLDWNAKMLRPLPSGRRRVLAWYDVGDAVPLCVLDDPGELIRQRLRPSTVITRDYGVTQRWALEIYRQRAFAGISWWSYCDSRWTTIGLWDRSVVTSHGIEELDIHHPALQEAATIVGVRIRSV